MTGILQPLNGVIRPETQSAGSPPGKQSHPDEAPSFMPRLQRLQMKRAAEGPRRRRHVTRPRPLTVRLLPQPVPPPAPPLPPTAAKTPALARLQAGAATAHTTPVEAILEMERGHGFAPTPLEGVPERAFAPPDTAFVPRNARLASLRSQEGDVAGSASDASTPALLPSRNCAPTPALPSMGVTTRSRSSRSSSGSPVDNFLLPPASAVGSPSGRTRSAMQQRGRSRFGADGGPSDAAVAAASEAIMRSGSSGASGEEDTFSFGVKHRDTASSLSPGGSSSHDDAAEGAMGPAESPDEPLPRTRWDTVSKAGTMRSAMRSGGSPADRSRRSSIGASVQQLRFGAPTPAPRQRSVARGHIAAPADADMQDAGDASADAAAAPQPVSPVERAMAEAVQQQQSGAAAAAEPAYSSDDDCGGYEGGDAGGDSDFDDVPPAVDDGHAVGSSPPAAAPSGFGSPAAEAAAENAAEAGDSQRLPAVTPAPQPRPATRAGGPRHQNERRKYCGRKSLAGLGLRTQGGVRRSSRSHHRPLEYWRNEKKVYTARDYTSAPSPWLLQPI